MNIFAGLTQNTKAFEFWKNVVLCGMSFYLYNDLQNKVLGSLGPVPTAVGNTLKRVVIFAALYGLFTYLFMDVFIVLFLFICYFVCSRIVLMLSMLLLMLLLLLIVGISSLPVNRSRCLK